MPTLHTLPIPADLLERACVAIAGASRAIPFDDEGTTVSRDLVAAAMEELNAEASRTLAISARTGDDGKVLIDGLDRHLLARGFAGRGIAACIARVLIESGIAAKASVSDRRSRRFLRAVRLGTPWTWTIAADDGGTVYRPETVSWHDKDAPWTSLCPVCRAGRLDPVTGQQLYGIPGTDFFACTHCGAKFVPDAGKFRLVAIAKRQDPAWSGLLNRTLAGEEWQDIARKGFLPGTNRTAAVPAGGPGKSYGRAGKPPEHPIRMEIRDRTLYFTPIPLVFSHGSRQDRFLARRDPLREILRLPAFSHLRKPVEERYGAYLDLPVGSVLAMLKSRKDLFYRDLLHPFGEQAFCSFKAAEIPVADRSGLFLIVLDNDIYAAGGTIRPFRELINGFGDIAPAACYLDGDSDRCRINSLLCERRQTSGIRVHALDNEEETGRFGAELAARFSRRGVQSGG